MSVAIGSKHISISFVGLVVFILVMTFYPLVAVAPWLFSVPSNPISVSYRFVYLTFSMLILMYGFVNNSKLRFSYGLYAFCFFWVVYIVRLIYDLSIRDVTAYASDVYLYTFAIGGSFLPALAMAVATPLIDSKKLVKLYWVFLTLANIVVFVQLIMIYGISAEVFTERLRITSEGKDIFNPIPLSRGGAMLAMMSLFFLLFEKHSLFRRGSLLLVLTLTLGLINLVLGASRGPIVSFLFVASIMITTHAYVVRKNISYLLKSTLAVLVTTILFILYAVPLIVEGKLSIVNRTMRALDKGFAEEARAYQWKAAFGQIEKSPVWGERIVENYANFYPHNIYIEIVLATGLIGGLLFIVIATDLLRQFVFSIKSNSIFLVLFFLLALQFMFGLSGLSIPTGWYFWVLIAVCLSCKLNYKNRRNQEYDADFFSLKANK